MDNEELSPTVLKFAYSTGFFPMPDPYTHKILWYKPDPRAIIPLNGFHCSRSLRRRIKKGDYQVTYNQAFTEVMRGCANREETWITPEFISSYTRLFEEGSAGSVEVWNDAGELTGGTYGVCLGGAFFAESMFHTETDCSKIALFHLVQKLRTKNFILLEVQFLTDHLKRLGAIEIPLSQYLALLKNSLEVSAEF